MAQAVLDPQNGKFTREFALGSTEILALFKSNSVITQIPFRPSGGDLFVYSSKDPLRIDDWKSDGHTCTNQGNKKPLPRTNPKYLKSYYYIKSNCKANKGFRKEVYFPVNTGNIIIHYIGDESLSEMKPHGNSNKKEPFFRTKPSVRNEILLKDFQNWKEVPLDSLLMSLKLIQGFYLEEIRRGKAQLGTFRLKQKYTRFASNILEFESRRLVCHPKDIVSSLRDRVLKEIEGNDVTELPKSADADNSRIIRAKMLASTDRIAFSSKLGIFVVADQAAVYTVQLYPVDLAIQKNIAVVRKNTRATKQKPGRKRPRPGDVSPVGNKEAKVNLDDIVNELEESILPELSEKGVEDLIELEEKINLKILEEAKRTQSQIEHTTENLNLPYEEKNSFIDLISSTPKSINFKIYSIFVMFRFFFVPFSRILSLVTVQ